MDPLTQRLKALSSAEDFLQFFGIAYEERVVHVNRLHILKRFYQYLHQARPLAGGEGTEAGLDEIELFRRYRELLARAYADFVRSDAITEKVFKVFQDAGGQRAVPVTTLREALAERRRAAA
jgi:nitrogenase-stabilizing/protective protein